MIITAVVATLFGTSRCSLMALRLLAVEACLRWQAKALRHFLANRPAEMLKSQFCACEQLGLLAQTNRKPGLSGFVDSARCSCVSGAALIPKKSSWQEQIIYIQKVLLP